MWVREGEFFLKRNDHPLHGDIGNENTKDRNKIDVHSDPNR